MVGGTRSGVLRLGDGKKKKGKRMLVVESDCEVRKGAGKGKESSLSSGSNEFGNDRGKCGNDEVSWIGKKRKLDVFEFDEYDRFDADLNLKKECGNDDGEGKTIRRTSGEAKHLDLEAENSGGDVVVYKRRSSFKSDADMSSSVRNKINKESMNINADSLFSSKKLDTSSESTGVQSKNGVLNLGVNKTRGRTSLKSCSRLEAEASESLSFGSGLTRNRLDNSSSVLEARIDDQSGTIGRTGKAFLNLHKSMSAKTSNKLGLEYNDIDTSSNSGRDLDSLKTVSKIQSQGNTSTPCKTTLAVPRSRHESSKRRGGTEKQKVRERIKQMLLDAGWTIDYRPRRDRGYSDAVYINTLGTCYWSIIKAYDALQKEAVDTNKRFKSEEESLFTPLPETILCKLTRSARQKLKKEKRLKHHKNFRSSRLNQDSVRSLDVKSESEETTSDNKEEDYETEGKEEKQCPRNKKFSRSMKDGNNFNCSAGSHYFGEFLHDKDLEYEDSNKRRKQLKARQNKKIGKNTLLIRSADKGMNPDDGYVPYAGKRTLLSWLIDSGTVEVNEKIQFMNRTRKRVLQQGRITRDGIHCICCNKILTIAKFEIHAGSKFQQPLQNIIIESGLPLSQCLLDAWNQTVESGDGYFHIVDVDRDDPNDDTCSICGDGGDLICCDGCPSTFHQNCLGIKFLPEGDWHCPQCICKYCGVIDETGADSDKSKCSLRTCSLCEMKYHHSCLMELESYADSSSFHSFCGLKCDELHKILLKSVGVRYELEEGFSWTLIRRTKVDSSDYANQNLVCNAKLAIAQTIMDECFLPIFDRRSQVNLIHNILYNCGSNFNRLNYQGFYTAILEKGDEIISAASLRFHGTRLAEMPFIGTRHIYRRQGMCRRLLSAVESALRSYKVEKLVIPAIPQLLHTWTEIFGFYQLERSDKEKLRSFNIMVFPGVDMLYKVLFETALLEDATVVKTGLYKKEEASSNLVCQDSGHLTNPNSPFDDKHACTEPRNGIVENIKEPCIASEQDKFCVGDGVVTNKNSVTPDLGKSQDCSVEKEVLFHNDEKSPPEVNSEDKEIESEPVYHNATKCVAADAVMEIGLLSESFVDNDVQSTDEADNNNFAGIINIELGSSDGYGELFTSGNCASLIACTGKKTHSRPLEQCTPSLIEDLQMMDQKVISNTPTCLNMFSDENLNDFPASASKSSTLAGPQHISNGDTNLEDAEIQKNLSPVRLKREILEISSHSSTANAMSATIERDEAFDMNQVP